MTSITLLASDGSLTTEDLRPAPEFTRPSAPLTRREVFAAAHVIPVAFGPTVPGAPAQLDWDATLAFRHHLWSWGLGVADAMDTAQRGMGLDARATRELITRSAAEAASVGGSLVVGVGTDQLEDDVVTLDRVADAYLEQLEFAENAGAGVVLMASRHLARAASSATDYERVYARVLDRVTAPVVLHWLGAAFDPQLAGYFGSGDQSVAADTVVAIMSEHAEKVRGIKMSLLDASAEVDLRGRLPRGTVMYTGDDFGYVDLIAGTDVAPDGTQEPGTYSDALLGAFAAIGPAASAALQALDVGDHAGYDRILRPTQQLSRHIFAAPTFYYKTGVAFLSWLNGHQGAFSMVAGLHAARSLPHLSEIVRLANACGALERPDLAAERWQALLELNGLGR